MKAKSNTASGMPLCLWQEGIGSRSSGKERDAEMSMSIFFDGGIGSKIDGFVQGANGSRFRSQCDT